MTPSVRQPTLRTLLFAIGVVVSWYGMMAVHELGHVAHGVLSGGRVERVSFPILGFSRTDVDPDPHPLFVAWGGVAWGVFLPVSVFGALQWLRRPMRRPARFFAGFCLVANGAYLAGGAIYPVGDAEVMVLLGTPRWVLVGVGLPCLIAGLWLWHRMARRDGVSRHAPFAQPEKPKR